MIQVIHEALFWRVEMREISYSCVGQPDGAHGKRHRRGTGLENGKGHQCPLVVLFFVSVLRRCYLFLPFFFLQTIENFCTHWRNDVVCFFLPCFCSRRSRASALRNDVVCFFDIVFVPDNGEISALTRATMLFVSFDIVSVTDNREFLHSLAQWVLRRGHLPPSHQGLHDSDGKHPVLVVFGSESFFFSDGIFSFSRNTRR